MSPDGTALNAERELSLTADFRPERTWLKGLWLRVRYGKGERGDGASDRRELRLILNYNLRALR